MEKAKETLTVTDGKSLPNEIAVKNEDLLQIKINI